MDSMKTNMIASMKTNLNVIDKPRNVIKNYSQSFSVILSNLLTNYLDNNDLECLLNNFIDSYIESNNPNEYTIDSVQVFHNTIYLEFANEFMALEAVKFFNNYEYNSLNIHALLINNKDLLFRVNEVFKVYDSENLHKDYSQEKSKFPEVDCEILVNTRQFKNFADSLNEKLQKQLLGITTNIKYLCDENNDEDEALTDSEKLKKLIKDAIKRNLLYVIQVDQTCNQFNSINVFILNQWKNVSEKDLAYDDFSPRISKIISKKKNFVKENRNMPLNKALDQLKDDYSDYIMYLKAKESIYFQMNNKHLNSTKKNEMSLNEKHHMLIKSLSEDLNKNTNKQLRTKDLEYLIIYLNRLKSDILGLEQCSQNSYDQEDETQSNNYNENSNSSENDNNLNASNNIKSLLDTDLTQHKPQIQPLMPLLQSPLQPLMQSPQQHNNPLLSVSPLLQHQQQQSQPQPLIQPQPLLPLPGQALLPQPPQSLLGSVPFFNSPSLSSAHLANMPQMNHSGQMPALLPTPLFPNFHSQQEVQRPQNLNSINNNIDQSSQSLMDQLPRSLMSLPPGHQPSAQSLMSVQMTNPPQFSNYNNGNDNYGQNENNNIDNYGQY
jgi:hypothetical protein